MVAQTQKPNQMKNSLLELEQLLRDLGNLYHDDMVITASVLVQNMSFMAANTSDDETSYESFQPYLSILSKMKSYRKDNHILQWASSEARMIVYSHYALEEMHSVDLATLADQEEEMKYQQ
jgi:hypothetical protein